MRLDQTRMISPRVWLLALLVGGCGLVTVQPSGAQTCTSTPPPSILTAQYGNLRQGYNASETMLTPTCIGSTVTIKQPTWSPLKVDNGPNDSPSNPVPNRIQAQPLYVSQISTTPALNNCPNPCNMLVAPTLTASVYAWNADTGATIWSNCQQSGCTNPALWADDCGTLQGAGISVGIYGVASLPFAGIASTPVIDTSVSPPVMYVTSLCETSSAQGAQQWWIHELNLYTGADQVTHQQITASVSGADAADDLSGGSIPFNAWETLQRSALLQVTVSGATPGNLVYVPFGFGAGEEKTTPYHGWVFGYDNSLTQQIQFVTTAKGWGGGSNTDSPSCSANCTCGGTSCQPGKGPPACIATNYIFAANWCGHAGGVWMSGRGGAANTISGTSHAYFGVGNGGFQQRDSTGALLATIQNWGNSVLDFQLSSSGGSYQAPSEYFTPYGGSNVPLQAGLLGNESGGNPVAKTFEGLSQNDFDMSPSGILLFDDLGSNHRLVIIDKAGYGYLLTQGNLCGSPSGCYPGASGGGAGGVDNDPGNAFSFAANQTQCPDQIGTAPGKDNSCHRVTSMAFYKDGSPPQLCVWPSYEVLACFQLSNNQQQSTAPAGTITASGGAAVTGSGTSFTSTVIPGDTLIAGGCTPGSTCPIITAVTDDADLTVSQNFTASGSWNYSGYFVNPLYDTHPTDSNVQYPGGGLAITSSSGSGPVVWGLANLGSSSPGTGVLNVYDASNLHLLWCSNAVGCTTSYSVFALPTFAVPTVANGYVYVPTAGITTADSHSTTCSSPITTTCSGVLVYSGH